MIKHQGGCHCGKVRFVTEYDPMLVSQCNCSRCRRLMGTVGVYTIYGSSDIEVTGESKSYDFMGGSGMPMHLHFCPECGTRTHAYADAFDGFMFLPIGAFDDNRELKPRIEYYRNYGLDWLTNDGCVEESFKEAAVVERMQALMENLDQRA